MFGTYKYVSNQEPSLTAGLQGFQGYGGLGIRQEALQTAGASGEEMDLLYDNRLVHTHRSWAEADPGLLQADQVLSQLSCGSPLAERSPSCPSSNMSESGHDFGGACALSSNQHHPGLMVDRSAHSASHLNHPAHSQWKWELASPTTANPAPGTSPLSNVSGASVVPVPQAAAVPAAHAYMLPFNNSYQPQQSAMPAVHNSIQQPQQQTTMPVVRPNSTTGESMLAPSQLSPEEEQQLLDILLPLADPLNLHLPEHQQQHQQQQFMMMPQLPTLQLSVPKRVPRLSVPQQPKQRAPRQLPAKWQAVPLHRELHVHIPKLPQSPHKPQPRPPQPKLQEQVTQPLSSGEAPQPKKRGRPPLTPGTYSRGYLAIKAYRQRKKGMVDQIEMDIADKQQELKALSAENHQLRLKQAALELTAAASEDVMRHLASLQLSVGAEPSAAAPTGSSSSGTGMGASPAAAAAALEGAIAAEVYRSSSSSGGIAAAAAHDVDWTAVLTRTEYQLQCAAMQARQQRLQQQDGAACAAVERYRAYVAAANLALRLEEQQQQAPFNSSDAPYFAPFPLAASDVVQIWQLHRTAAPAAAAAPSSSSTGSTISMDPPAAAFAELDLEVGTATQVSEEFWAMAAQSVPLLPGQQQQLEALWELYTSRLDALVSERLQLVQQLQLGASEHSTLENALGVAAAVEGYMVRARTLVVTFESAMRQALSDEQVCRMCVASWLHMPLVRAVVGHLIGKGEGQAASAAAILSPC